MPLRTIAELNASSSPEDVDALRKLQAKKSLIIAELVATTRKLKDAVALGDSTLAVEHAQNIAPEDIESHIKNRIGELLNIDPTSVQLPESLDHLHSNQLEVVWQVVKSNEINADHHLSTSTILVK